MSELHWQGSIFEWDANPCRFFTAQITNDYPSVLVIGYACMVHMAKQC